MSRIAFTQSEGAPAYVVVSVMSRRQKTSLMESGTVAPAIVGAVVAISIILTVALGLIGGTSTADTQRIPGLTGIEQFFTEAPDWIAGLFGGEIWLMLLVYGLMATGFVLTGGLLALRYIRD